MNLLWVLRLCALWAICAIDGAYLGDGGDWHVFVIVALLVVCIALTPVWTDE